MGVPGNANALLLRSAAAAGSYQVSRSLRFNSPDSAYLSRTPSVAGNRRTWTFSCWVKRAELNTFQSLFCCIASGLSHYLQFTFESDNCLLLYDSVATGGVALKTTQVFRDSSAWYHLVLQYNTTDATASNKVKLYVNGSEITQFSTDNRSSLTSDSSINRAEQHSISGRQPYSTNYFGGYLADIHFIDGQALDPSSFTTTDPTTGQLIPKAYSGTYGTNGFHLPFSDNSTAAALGTDTSGNGNTWTTNNFSVTAGAGNDSLVDTPSSAGTDSGLGGQVTGNYCTLNPLNNGGVTLTNGNLDWQRTAGGSTAVAYSTIAVSSGKWYFETTLNGAGGGVNWEFGVATVGTSNAIRPGTTATGWGLVSSSNTTLYKQNSNTLTSIFTGTLSNGDVIGVAIDLDNGRIWFARNNTWLEGSPSAGTGASYTNLSGTVAVFAGGDGSAVNGSFNAGARPFAYTAPSGFKALCDTNLPAPVVAKPNTAFDVVTYTGNGNSTRTINGLQFSPDLVWTKARSQAYGQNWYDIVRGTGKVLRSDLTDAELSNSTEGYLSAFNSDGYTMSAGSNTTKNGNELNTTYVGWVWDAGTSTVTNTQGSITSSVRANASAGFSIVTYTTPSSGGPWTVGHGLNVAPSLIICKNRSSTGSWIVYHTITGNSGYLLLNATDAFVTQSQTWNSASPSSTVFTQGTTAWWGASANFVSYCFAPVTGYSSMGSYVGNGSADGPFVYTGFRPRWVMVKNTTLGTINDYWVLFDAARNGYNVTEQILIPNLSDAEGTSTNNGIDLLSNGFKWRATHTSRNASGSTYIYAAFAESPFQYARAR